MSQFSGKCDFYDGFVMIYCDGDEEKVKKELKNLTLYMYGKDKRYHLVKSETILDIAKYYPYIESIMCGSKNGGRTVYLSSDSFIDMEESEVRMYRINDVLKYWRKCKRNKEPFDQEKCLESLWYPKSEGIKEIVKRISEKGDKAEFDDIHFPVWEYFRRKWFNELVKLGLDELNAYNWCFKSVFDPEETVVKRLGRPLNMEKKSEQV